jgi:F0F1-type ATP synthase membrane subunit b/b'
MNLNPLTQINPITIVSTMVIFLVTYFALKKLYVDKYVEFIETRTREVSDGRAAGLEAEAITVKAKADAEEILRGARSEADDIAAQTRTDAYELREEHRLAAAGEAEKIVAGGRERLQTIKDKEQVLLETELVDCVWRVVSKLDGKIERTTVAAVVRRNIAATESKAGPVNG